MARRIIRTALIGLGIGLAVMALRGGFSAAGQETFLVALCDALFVTGALLTGAALLIWASGEGAFNAISYGTRKAFDQIRREENRNRTAKTYYDFVAERQEKKKGFPVPLLIAGLVFLAAAAAVLIIYLHLYS